MYQAWRRRGRKYSRPSAALERARTSNRFGPADDGDSAYHLLHDEKGILMLTIEPHPLLDLRAFVTEFPRSLGDTPTPPDLFALLAENAAAPLHSDDQVRETVRALLRHGGFKPTGRSKPASEYLLKAVRDKLLSPINLAVDVCNIVSFHSGLPISVVDLDKAREPLRVGIATTGMTYVFNVSGQTIDLGGLLCLFDAGGPCANAVKDAQRTKTDAATRRTLSLIWGTMALPGRATKAEQWYRSLLEAHGVATRNW
jgi:DNA/RNA-binding domain of Phe-tRNA-synthetase-like protein